MRVIIVVVAIGLLAQASPAQATLVTSGFVEVVPAPINRLTISFTATDSVILLGWSVNLGILSFDTTGGGSSDFFEIISGGIGPVTVDPATAAARDGADTLGLTFPNTGNLLEVFSSGDTYGFNIDIDPPFPFEVTTAAALVDNLSTTFVFLDNVAGWTGSISPTFSVVGNNAAASFTNFEFTPEPSTYVLMGTGLLALALLGRRRRKGA